MVRPLFELPLKFGIVKISDKFLNRVAKDPLVKRVFDDLIPVRAEFMYNSRCLEYHAWCEKFRILGLGEPMPEYQAEINSDTGEIEWKEL